MITEDQTENENQSIDLDPEVIESQRLLRLYLTAAQDYREDQQQWYSFTFGDQWKEDVRKILESRNQAPVMFNYIAPAVEQAIAYLTAKSPSFSATGRDDSDVKAGRVMADFLSYLWYRSDGDLHFVRVAMDYFVRGLGYMVVWPDKNSDFGRGELKVEYADTNEIVVDPSSKHPLYDDAASIIYFRDITEEAFKARWPEYEHLLVNAMPAGPDESPDQEFDNDDGGNTLRNRNSDFVQEPEKILRLTSRFTKINVLYNRILDTRNNNEIIKSQEDYEKFLAEPVIVLITAQSTEYVESEREAQMMLMQYQQSQIPAQVGEATRQAMLDDKIYKTVQYKQNRIKDVTDIGGQLMWNEPLPISNYNIIPFHNKHTNTPYSSSDVSMVVSVQQFVNKMTSLVVAYMQASTTLKLLVPEGSVQDISKLEEDWKRPDAVITYDSSYGTPTVPIMTPLSNSVFQLIQMGKSMIEYEFGIFESMMGNGAQSPDTYKGTMAVDEFGQRRIRYKLRQMEKSLRRVAQVLMEWSGEFYTAEKLFKIIAPNGDVKQGTVNIPMYDDKGAFVDTIFNLNKNYDVIVLGGSTLPSNRWAEYETYKDAYQIGMIDQPEALKKTEIFDREGVLNRMDKMKALSGQVEQLTEELKQVTGDLQTAQRESTHDRKRVEVEKFKTDLNTLMAKLEAGGELDAKKLELEVKGLLGDIKTEMIKQDNLNGDKKKAPSKDSATKPRSEK